MSVTVLLEAPVRAEEIANMTNLYDPTDYLTRIRQRAGDIYVVVEEEDFQKALRTDRRHPLFLPISTSLAGDADHPAGCTGTGVSGRLRP